MLTICISAFYLLFETANKANKDFTQGILDIEDLVELGQKHRLIIIIIAIECCSLQ